MGAKKRNLGVGEGPGLPVGGAGTPPELPLPHRSHGTPGAAPGAGAGPARHRDRTRRGPTCLVLQPIGGGQRGRGLHGAAWGGAAPIGRLLPEPRLRLQAPPTRALPQLPVALSDPSPGAWGPWEPWSSCSVTCDEGTQRRGRSRGHGGGHDGDSTEWQLRACDMGCCPDVGHWGPWSPWGHCSVTCGGGGAQRRHRSCSSPSPQCGVTCGPGDSEDTRACQGTVATCPVAGAWGPWGSWGPCSGSCRGSGPGPERSRRRLCDSPEPSRDPPGDPCPGSDTDSQPCPGLPPCPVDGAWGAWSPATPCLVTCGLGGVVQRRSCDAPSPKHGGRGCEGPQTRRGLCGPRDPCPAPVHWGPWGPWSPCRRPWGDISCSQAVGQQKRTRDCEGRSPGGAACPTEHGGSIELRACYSLHNCVLRGNWSDWSPWGLCTPPCGASPSRSRSRECQASLPEYPMTVPRVGSPGVSPVSFWGAPRPLCAPLQGQRLRLEESRPCRNVLPCPHPEEEGDSR